VLDVATGTGEVLLASAHRCGERGQVVGIDLSAAMLERAAGAIRGLHLNNANVRQMDAEELKFPDESFDVALCAFGLSSFPDMTRALGECWRILYPGGRLGLVDSVRWYFEHDARWCWQEEVLRSFGALRQSDQADTQLADLPSLLTTLGFTAVRSTEDAFELLFRDEEEWWRWMWSHGTRHLLEAVPSTRRDKLKQELCRHLGGCRERDGMFHGTMHATLMRAQKPPRA
jgi:SAM-dependent methyltransferase